MHYNTNVYWNKGAVRKVNQDSLVVLQVLTSRGRVLMAAVCDGMGGLDMGECASGYVTEELITWFYDSLLDAVGKKKHLWVIRRSMERKVYQIQSRLQRYAGKHTLAMGSTLSLLLLWEKRYLLWHLGDSRIYHLYGRRKNRISLLTKDHACGNNILTKCVGSFGFFMPDFKMGTVKDGEGFLICSDGFWRRVKKVEIGDVLAPFQMTKKRGERRLQEVGDAVMRRGETDNLSAVYISVCSRQKEACQ